MRISRLISKEEQGCLDSRVWRKVEEDEVEEEEGEEIFFIPFFEVKYFLHEGKFGTITGG